MSLVTTKEAAQILGVTAVRVRQLIKDGRLVAEKRGRDHLLEDCEVQRFKRHGRRSEVELVGAGVERKRKNKACGRAVLYGCDY